jgi:hypothetical protein
MKVHLILQSKGGCGKSLLTWFLANFYAYDESTVFMDIDESTKTSSTRLDSILPKGQSVFYPILNEQKKLERELFLNLFEKISRLSASNVFLDFGAPESEEFRKLLEFEIDAKSLTEELQLLGIELVLLVVIAGRDAFASCTRFLTSLSDLVDGAIPTKILMNDGTFGGIEGISIGKQNLEVLGKSTVFHFGNLGDSQSGKDIIKLISNGQKPENLSLAVKLTFKKAMAQVENLINNSI